MKRAFLTAAALLSAILISAPAGAENLYFRGLERGALPEVRSPAVRSLTLPNGMRCYLLSDSTLPIVKVSVITRTGSMYDPDDKVGLAALTGAHMRIGGAGELAAEAFDRRIDDMGASLSSIATREMTIATLSILSEDLGEGMRLFFDMLFSPRFDEARLATARKAMEEEILREDDDPDAQADRAFREMIYGKKSPWARRPDRRSISRIKPEDTASFHGQYFKANNMILAAAGDFSYDRMIELLTALGSSAPTGEIAFADVEPVELKFGDARKDIRRKSSQSFVRMGHLGVKRDNPDRFPLYLVDAILGGGGFKSRLMEDIRVKRGMAYSIYSSISPERDYGLFLVSLDTKADQSEEAIELVKGHLERLAQDADFTAEELDFARRSMISRLVFLFDQPFSVVNQRARYFYYGYPDDFWRVYRDAIMAADLDDLKRVAKQYIHPDGLGVVVVGPKTGSKKAGGRGD